MLQQVPYDVARFLADGFDGGGPASSRSNLFDLLSVLLEGMFRAGRVKFKNRGVTGGTVPCGA